MPGDHPDFYQVEDPGVTRWAPGTAFHGINYGADLASLGTLNIDFDVPNDAKTYVLDTVFLQTKIIGSMEWSIWFAADAAAPSYNQIASGDANKCVQVKPFSLVSMAVTYPNRIRTVIYNPNLFTRWVQLNISCYSYY